MTATGYTSQIIELHHFLPLQTMLLAIYARLFALVTDIKRTLAPVANPTVKTVSKEPIITEPTGMDMDLDLGVPVEQNFSPAPMPPPPEPMAVDRVQRPIDVTSVMPSPSPKIRKSSPSPPAPPRPKKKKKASKASKNAMDDIFGDF